MTPSNPEEWSWIERLGVWVAAGLAAVFSALKLRVRSRDRLAIRLGAKADVRAVEAQHFAMREDIGHHHTAILDLYAKHDALRGAVNDLAIRVERGFAEAQRTGLQHHAELLAIIRNNGRD